LAGLLGAVGVELLDEESPAGAVLDESPEDSVELEPDLPPDWALALAPDFALSRESVR
jgi:hypothetical protein